MAYMCQGCSAEGESWPGECPHCHSKLYLNVASRKQETIGQLINGKYKVVSKLGQGGMGTVFKAVREEMGQTLAIKMLNPEFSNEPEVVKRFLREAKSYGAVQHPNAVNLLDFGQTGEGALYIAMEFIQGRDLGRTIAEKGRLSIPEAIDVCVQCCDVLGYAHEKGIIHRDLKPENIMLVRGLRGYTAKVLDFGIARLVGENNTQLTIQGTICGTPRYMSPEQARGKEIDNRSDIYALGLVLFEMLTGRQAYTSTAITDLLRAQVHEPVPHLWEVESAKDLPPQLDLIVQRACAKDRDQRFVSMGQLADALSKALPTLHELKPITDSQMQQLQTSNDPAAPGRTFLGPGAQGAIAQPQSIQNAATLMRSEVHVDAHQTGQAIPADSIAARVKPSPMLDAQTMLKQPTPMPATELRTPQSQTLPLGNERPSQPAARSGGKSGMVIGGVVIAVLGIGAVIAVPRLTAKPQESLQPVPTPPPTETKLPEKPPEVAQNTPPQPTPTKNAPPTPSNQLAQNMPPTPQPNPPSTTTGGTVAKHPGNSATVSAITEQSSLAALRDAERDFADGNMNGVEVALKQVDPKSKAAGDAASLRSKYAEARRELEDGSSAAESGNCQAAIKHFRVALGLSQGLHQAARGIEKCEKGSVPDAIDQ